MAEFADTMPVRRPAPYEPASYTDAIAEIEAQRYRDAQGDDATDYARNCEAEEGRFGLFEGLLSWPALISAVTVGAVAAAVIAMTMGGAL